MTSWTARPTTLICLGYKLKGTNRLFIPAQNLVTDKVQASAFALAHPFAVVCINGDSGPIVAHVPLVGVLDDSGVLVELVGHVARGNPFHEAIGKDGAPVVAVFRGADAYVSPSLYPSKLEHGKAVPTWNYLAAEARGVIHVDRDPANMADYLVPLTQMMESHRPNPWAVSDAPADYMAMMMRGIVGLRIAVCELSAKRKISQGKSQADYESVVNAFAASGNQNEQIISSEMTKESSFPS
jgi:transcriptional regulator